MKKFKVAIIESKFDLVGISKIKEFDTEKEACEFVHEFNTKNTKEVVPDWYMYAELIN